MSADGTTTPTTEISKPCGPDANVGVEFSVEGATGSTVFGLHLVSDEPGCLARTRGWIEIDPEPIEGLVRVGYPFFAAHDTLTGAREEEGPSNELIAAWVLTNWYNEPISLLAAQAEVMASTVFDSRCDDPTQPAVLARLEDPAR